MTGDVKRLPQPGGPAHLANIGRAKADANDTAIDKAAAALVEEGVWPSPERIAASSGVSEATVRRRKALVDRWRRVYAERHGAPRHWTPNAASAPVSAADSASDPRTERLKRQLKYAVGLVRKTRRLRKADAAMIEDLSEKLRRALIERRPVAVAEAIAGRKAPGS